LIKNNPSESAKSKKNTSKLVVENTNQ